MIAIMWLFYMQCPECRYNFLIVILVLLFTEFCSLTQDQKQFGFVQNRFGPDLKLPFMCKNYFESILLGNYIQSKYFFKTRTLFFMFHVFDFNHFCQFFSTDNCSHLTPET